MKSYEDITERVFRKGDEILEKKRRRTAIIKRTSLAVSGICAVVLVNLGVWKNNNIKNAVNDYSGDYQIITENDESVTPKSIEKPIQTSVTEPAKYTTVPYAKPLLRILQKIGLYPRRQQQLSAFQVILFTLQQFRHGLFRQFKRKCRQPPYKKQSRRPSAQHHKQI